MTDPTTLDHILIAVIAAYILYAVFLGQPKVKGQTYSTKEKLSIYWSNGIILWVGAIGTGVVWKLGGRSLADLGLTWRHVSIGIGAAIAAGFVAWFLFEFWRQMTTDANREKLLAHWRQCAPFLPENPKELGHFSFLGITAGITEEIIMRGFAVSYLMAFTGDSPAGLAVAVTLPAAAFAFAHRYEGLKDMVNIFVLAILFGAIFVVTGSLLIPIVLHALGDIAAGYMAYRLASEDREQKAVAG